MKTPITALAAYAAFGALLCPSLSLADNLNATLGQPLTETSHTVDVKIANGVATLVVQRVFHNAGTIEEEASLDIDLPVEAVATGLRIKSGDVWYSGDLMDREEAEELYIELTGLGVFDPKDPAILFWETLGVLHLQVFPIFPGKSSTVEYTLTVPTEYADGRYHLSYPKQTTGANLVEPLFRFTGEAKGIKAFIDDNSIALETRSKSAPKKQTKIDYEIEGGTTRIRSKLNITKKGIIAKASVSIEIKHTFRGDLRVIMQGPDGTQQVLSEQEGGGENDLIGSFELEDFIENDLNGEWQMIVEDHAGVDVGVLKSWKMSVELKDGAKHTFAAKDLPIYIPDVARDGGDAGYSRLSTTAPTIDTLLGRLGRVKATNDSFLYRVELDAAPQLRPLPKNLSVVFLVDASHSVNEGGVEVQLAMIRSFLSHVPDAKAEIVVYRRFATQVFGQFTAMSAFESSLKKALDADKFTLGNGSAIDEGLSLATTLIKERSGQTMIVALTDTMLRKRFTNDLALNAMKDLPKTTIVHLVYRDDEERDPEAIRQDEEPLTELASTHGGVYWRVVGNAKTSKAELASAVLSLVRPTSIDQCTVLMPDGEKVAFGEFPDKMREGTGTRFMGLQSDAPTRLTVVGKLWQEEMRREFTVTKEFSKYTAAFAFSTDLYADLSEDQQRAIAFYAGAVSPVTSYLAIEPGVRPSRAGIERSGFGVGGGGGSGSGFGRGFGLMGIRPVKDIAALAKSETDKCFASYSTPNNWSLELEAETNYDELIDVITSKSDPLSACIVDAIWSVTLTLSFREKQEFFTLKY